MRVFVVQQSGLPKLRGARLRESVVRVSCWQCVAFVTGSLIPETLLPIECGRPSRVRVGCASHQTSLPFTLMRTQVHSLR